MTFYLSRFICLHVDLSPGNKTRQGYLISDIERFEAAVTCEITEGNDLKQLMNDYVDSLAKKKQVNSTLSFSHESFLIDL